VLCSVTAKGNSKRQKILINGIEVILEDRNSIIETITKSLIPNPFYVKSNINVIYRNISDNIRNHLAVYESHINCCCV
jgi:hypothetical protein